ncbi:MAG: DEAD/DEAH box helicase [Candidatus Onthomonas sp.]|nr:DEAD/DEAH box helicase [Candidatus Onthomonas sp.]
MDFETLQLIEPIRKALSEQGYTEATAIQAGAIPPALEGRDVLGSARTGTGKTCAFATPILQRLSQRPVEGRPIRALILTPTRELAIQNQEQMVAYGKYLPLKSVVIFGGVGQKPQVDAIQAGADILIATPGRLADLYGQGLLDLSRLEIFVLDEADRMLDMGFIHDVRKILKWLPREKQTLFFSATMPEEIMDLVNRLLKNPARVAVDPVSSPVEAIEQSAWPVDRENKTKLIVWLLEQRKIPSALVFTRTKHGADKVSRDLNRAGVTSAAIHGNKSQTARQNALASFKAGKIRVLVATDIAARGLDIQDLPCVFNYNLPEVPETYIHRIGRTGRAGKEGVAFTLYDFGEQPLLREVEKLMGKKVEVHKEHPWPMERFEAPVRDKHGKIINAEDAEARQAAREKRNARRAEGAAKARAKHAPAQAEQKSPAKQVPEQKPAAIPAEREEEIPYYSLDLLPPRTEQQLESNTPFDSKDILTRKYKRPARRVVPSLSQVSLLPGSELKETFSARLRTDDESVLPSRTGDATDRLLARKKSAGKSEKSSGRKKPASKGKRKPEEKKSGPEKPAVPSPQTGQRTDPSHSGKKKNGKQPQAETAGKAAGGKRGTRRTATRKSGGQGRAVKRPVQPDSWTHQKDSTEQASLMKPYYLSDLKKR